MTIPSKIHYQLELDAAATTLHHIATHEAASAPLPSAPLPSAHSPPHLCNDCILDHAVPNGDRWQDPWGGIDGGQRVVELKLRWLRMGQWQLRMGTWGHGTDRLRMSAWGRGRLHMGA